MRFDEYDIISSLYNRVEEFRARHGLEPSVIVLSPEAYQWLRAIQDDEIPLSDEQIPNIGDWICNVGDAALRVEIDEMADNFSIRLR